MTSTAPDTRETTIEVPEGDEDWHGTLNGYSNRKCRGPRCRASWAKYVADRKAQRTQQTPPSHVHGTPNGYGNWGCRCTECTAAWTASARERTQNLAA